MVPANATHRPAFVEPLRAPPARCAVSPPARCAGRTNGRKAVGRDRPQARRPWDRAPRAPSGASKPLPGTSAGRRVLFSKRHPLVGAPTARPTRTAARHKAEVSRDEGSLATMTPWRVDNGRSTVGELEPRTSWSSSVASSGTPESPQVSASGQWRPLPRCTRPRSRAWSERSSPTRRSARMRSCSRSWACASVSVPSPTVTLSGTRHRCGCWSASRRSCRRAPIFGRRCRWGSPGDRRAWDATLTLGGERCPVEAETAIRDLQATDRRIALKMNDAGIAMVILLVADTAANRIVLRAHRDLLRDRYPLDGRAILRALRAGRVPDTSGILLR